MSRVFLKPLPSDEQLVLVKRAQRGDVRARHLLAETSMAFVRSLAIKFAHGRPDVIDDMLGAGAIGLLEAIDRFDLKRKNKFLTYAGPWVRMRMQERMINDATPLAGGRSANEQDRETMNAYNRALSFGLDHLEALDVAAAELGTSTEAVRRGVERRHRTFSQVSFDAPVGGDSTTTVGETVVADVEPVDDVLSAEEGRRGLRARLEAMDLSDRERTMVEHRFMGGETLEVVAKRLGVTRQRVQQIEVKLVRKLRKFLAPDLDVAQPRVLGSQFSDRIAMPARAFWVPPPSAPVVPSRNAEEETAWQLARERARRAPKASRGRLCACSHPETWHSEGRCGHGCGCLAFKARQKGRPGRAVVAHEDDLPPGQCPALKSERIRRPCGRPAIFGDLCVFHGMRAERGEPVVLCLSLRERVDKLWPSMTEDERVVAKSYVIEHVSIDKVARSIGDTRTQVLHLAASLTKRLQDIGTVSPALPAPEPTRVGKVLLFRRAPAANQRRTAT